MQIDEWLPLYKGNIYVVDEVTGRMYLSKGEHLMRIAETASHCPFQDHELSISWHVLEREYAEQQDQLIGGKVETDWGRSNLDPITPIVGTTGGMGRTPILVAESTRQPGREAFTPGEASGGEAPEHSNVPMGLRQVPEKSTGKGLSAQEGEEPEWTLPKPAEPHTPPGGSITERDVPSQPVGEQEEKLPKQEYPTPEQ